jgi:hypothetical protein
VDGGGAESGMSAAVPCPVETFAAPERHGKSLSVCAAHATGFEKGAVSNSSNKQIGNTFFDLFGMIFPHSFRTVSTPQHLRIICLEDFGDCFTAKRSTVSASRQG